MKFVLVAGASGYLGRHVVAELKRQGHRVRALVRQRDPLWKRSEQLAPAVGSEVDEIVMGDLTQPQTLRGVCQGIQMIVSCAGMSQSDVGKFTPEQVDYNGNRNLLIEAINSGGVEKFIYVSMKPRKGNGFEELSAAKEKFVKDLQESVMTSYILRPTLYFCELLPLLYMAHHGRVWIPGDPERKINPIHGRDLAQALIKGMIAKEKETDIGGSETFSFEELARLMFKVLNKPAKIVHVPAAFAPVARQNLQIFAKSQLQAYDFMASGALNTGVAPAQGSQKLEAYLKSYLESPFFRA